MGLVSAVLLLAALGCVALALGASRLRRGAAAGALVVLLLAAGFWSLAYTLELTADGSGMRELWGDLKYVGVVLVPAAFVVFALEYADRGPRVSRRLLAALAVEPVAVFVLLALPPTHDLFRYYRPDAPGGPAQAGPLFWPHLVYTDALLVGAATVLVATLFRTSPMLRWQATILAAVVALPWLSNLAFNLGWAYHLGWGPFAAVDLTPFATTISGLGLLVGFLRTRVLGLRPVAQRQVFATVPDPIIVLDGADRVVDANPAAESLFGEPLSRALGHPLVALLPAWRDLLALPLPSRVEASAAAGVFEVTRAALGERRGRVPASLLVARNVTVRKRIEAQLEGQARILALIARDAPLAETLPFLVRWVQERLSDARCAVLLRRPDAPTLRVVAGVDLPAEVFASGDTLTVAEDAGCFGYAAWARAALVVPDLLADARWERARTGLLANAVRACWAEPIVGSGSGEVRGVFACCFREPRTPSPSEKGLVELAARLVDIAVERAEANALIEHQATHDALTGLPNRLTFLDRLERALAASSRDPRNLVAVAFIDLDRFKWVNDTLGHEAGDRLLVEVAGRLRRALRPADTVARFGGDEFTVLLEHLADESAAVEIMDRFAEQLTHPLAIGATRTPVSASIGLALARGGGRADDLISDADTAMYRAKERGGGRSEVYDVALRQRADERRALRAAILAAAEHGELCVVYQPAVSLGDGRVLAAEAFVRWAHPQRGLLPAAEFLPAAEEMGLGGRIGRFVLGEVVAEVARRHPNGASPLGALSLAVNVSHRQLVDPSFVPTVHDLLRSAGADPTRLVVEVRESALAEAGTEEVSALEQLRALGVQLVIDNFGAGACSLQQLKRLPVFGLKVDASFVAGLGRSRGDTGIVGAIIDLAHALDLVAFAEGVETAGQLRSLRAIGCDVAQGHHIAQPGPLDESLAALGGRGRG